MPVPHGRWFRWYASGLLPPPGWCGRPSRPEEDEGGRARFEPVTFSASGLLGDLVCVRQARSRCLRCYPGLAVITFGRPPHRATRRARLGIGR